MDYEFPNEINKVLVTGGSGFIGGHVVDKLLEKGYEVSVFDRNKRNDYPEEVTVYLGDTRDYEAVSEAVAKNDGVIHLAGILGTQETIDKPKPSVQTNIIGGLNVFEACRFYNKKGVYIAVGNHWMLNSYAITKTTAEKFAFMYNEEHDTKIAVVRGLNAYGPRQKHKPVKKITPNFILPALRDETITIYGSGEQQMDMIYVKDLAEILIRALVKDYDVYDSVFEGGTGKAPTVNKIAETIVDITDSDCEVKHTDMRPGEEKESVVKADPETLKPLFDGNLPEFTSLKEGMEKTVEYYRKNLEKY